MQMTWWGANLLCPKCNKDTTLQLCNFSADGELMFVFYCTTCKELIHWRIFASSLAHRALVQDINREKNKQLAPSKPVKPPLQISRVIDKLTVADAKWLKSMEIDPEDGKLK